jgi:hypothetical protein
MLILSFGTGIAQENNDRDSDLRQLHAQAVHELENGTSKDAIAPPLVQHQVEQITGFHSKGPGISWSDVLRLTEFGLQKNDRKVTIVVKSQPNSCSVHYTPVIGGDILDGGLTPATISVDPKYYSISCSCGVETLNQRIDGTLDREVLFPCETRKRK